MAGKSTLRKSSHRTRTAVVGAVLAAGTVTGALALGGAAYAGSSDPGAVASAESDSFISEAEFDAALPFFVAGYTYDDAVVLAEQWKSPSAYDAKISGGETLPIEPSGPPVTAEELAAGEAPSS